ncbi:MAG: dihydrolipoamide acetyltransferase family protein [Dermatophilaceae bacterium]
MTVQEFRLPDPGEGLTEAEIVEWKVAVGDTVKVNDIVVEVETAKSLVELPVPFAGTVVALLVAEGETVEVGTPIIAVDTGGDRAPAPAPAAQPAAAAAPAAPDQAAESPAAPAAPERTAVLVGYGVKATEARRRPRHTVPASKPEESLVPVASARPGQLVAAHATEVPVATPEPSLRRPDGEPGAKVRAKPPVRKYAKDHGVDLTRITGTGPDGVITRADVDSLLGRSDGAAAAVPQGMPSAAQPRGETRIPIKGVRKVTAAAMVGSAFTAPHVTEWVTVDVTRTVELVERLKADREFKGVKVTALLVLAKAMCLAVRRHPHINATWDEARQQIVVKDYVNLGIAAATPRGLLVPNVKDADLMSMRELADAVGVLTATARDGRTQPADTSGGTITLTNVGTFGVDTGTPILNPGEAAIVVFGAIRKQPWVVTGADGRDELAIRHVTNLGLSFDHRLVDGELGSRYLADLAAILEDPARGLVWG